MQRGVVGRFGWRTEIGVKAGLAGSCKRTSGLGSCVTRSHQHELCVQIMTSAGVNPPTRSANAVELLSKLDTKGSQGAGVRTDPKLI